jgi:hypothetical protein
MHAEVWMSRIADGPAEGRARLTSALSDVFDDAVMLFEPLAKEDDALEEGWLPVPSDELRRRFLDTVAPTFEELGLPADPHQRAESKTEFIASSSGDLIAGDALNDGRIANPEGPGGRRGVHSAELRSLWDDMTSTYRGDPDASW